MDLEVKWDVSSMMTWLQYLKEAKQPFCLLHHGHPSVCSLPTPLPAPQDFFRITEGLLENHSMIRFGAQFPH